MKPRDLVPDCLVPKWEAGRYCPWCGFKYVLALPPDPATFRDCPQRTIPAMALVWLKRFPPVRYLRMRHKLNWVKRMAASWRWHDR